MIELGKVFHLTWPRMKHEENSPRGDAEAVATGCESTDLDMTLDANGDPWNNHWEMPMLRDGFMDPEKRMPIHTKFRDMTPNQIERLVAVTHGHEYRIHRMHQRIAHAHRLGLKIRAEAKRHPAWTVDVFRQLKRDADECGAIMVIATLDNWRGWRRTLRNARRAGFETRRLRG